MTELVKKACFVIAPIGEPESDTRKRSDQVLRHIIRPAVEGLGYLATRADEISQPGNITTQVIQRIIDDPLVIADLTERNPNVYYELAVRHAIRKPFVQIIQEGEEIPFDVAGTRTIFFNLQDPDRVANAKDEMTEQIRALEQDPSDLQTPITVSLDLQRLRGSDNPDVRSIADLVADFTEMRGTQSQNIDSLSAKVDELSSAVRASQRRPITVDPSKSKILVEQQQYQYSFIILLAGIRDIAPWIYEIGLEAFRKAIDGDIEKAVHLYQQMDGFIRQAKTILPNSFKESAEHLPVLFDRMIGTSAGPVEPDDLPF